MSPRLGRALRVLRALLENTAFAALGLADRLPEPPPQVRLEVPVLEVGSRLAHDGRHWQVVALQATDADLAVVCWPGSPTTVAAP